MMKPSENVLRMQKLQLSIYILFYFIYQTRTRKYKFKEGDSIANSIKERMKLHVQFIFFYVTCTDNENQLCTKRNIHIFVNDVISFITIINDRANNSEQLDLINMATYVVGS